jgi:hypothetical protein
MPASSDMATRGCKSAGRQPPWVILAWHTLSKGGTSRWRPQAPGLSHPGLWIEPQPSLPSFISHAPAIPLVRREGESVLAQKEQVL